MSQPDLRYPVGKYSRPTAALTSAERGALIDAIAQMPANVRAAVEGGSGYFSDVAVTRMRRPWDARGEASGEMTER